MNQPVVSIVVPCYDESETVPIFVQKVSDIISELQDENLISKDSFILFVDDGSTDNTWALIERYANLNKQIYGIRLTKNFGQQNALMAGYRNAHIASDVIISMDVDLQDDPNAIRDMILKHLEGYDVVYGVRSSRDKDKWFKRKTSFLFYKIMRRLGVHIIPDHAHYRLLSKKAVTALLRFEERNLFLQGIIPMLGLNQTVVYYKRNERSAGKSKYNLRKLVESALEGITSFTTIPLRFITIAGTSMLFNSLLMGVYSLGSKVLGLAYQGWTSIMLSLWFIGGILTLSLGIIGEYIGKIYIETKKRPRYFVKEKIFPFGGDKNNAKYSSKYSSVSDYNHNG
ncbi:MAG: Glycosyltransferase [Candidatus Carbobacillus altaicus]|uniref:Glycosyltransferase n=1 Tax=Candidatus Carbonibacillus altaicus TaxID=2163959 RepID=A0A2R6Y0R8_9BACL|nr:MAG: Glycosyltransferase [Candidatus Carbobacillus altaicus]